MKQPMIRSFRMCKLQARRELVDFVEDELGRGKSSETICRTVGTLCDNPGAGFQGK